jgi:hypothetical protein
MAKAILYCVLFIVFFTPVFVPITAAGPIVIPALGIGFYEFWWTPWNFVLIPMSLAFAVLSANRMFKPGTGPNMPNSRLLRDACASALKRASFGAPNPGR